MLHYFFLVNSLRGPLIQKFRQLILTDKNYTFSNSYATFDLKNILHNTRRYFYCLRSECLTLIFIRYIRKIIFFHNRDVVSYFLQNLTQYVYSIMSKAINFISIQNRRQNCKFVCFMLYVDWYFVMAFRWKCCFDIQRNRRII